MFCANQALFAWLGHHISLCVSSMRTADGRVLTALEKVKGKKAVFNYAQHQGDMVL